MSRTVSLGIMRATAEPVTANPTSTGTTTIQREMDIKRPPKTESGQTSHRHPQVPGWSPIVVVIAPAFGVALWHGGFTRGGQLAIAAIAVAGVAWFRPRPRSRGCRARGRADGGGPGEPGIAGLESRGQLNGGGAGGDRASAAGGAGRGGTAGAGAVAAADRAGAGAGDRHGRAGRTGPAQPAAGRADRGRLARRRHLRVPAGAGPVLRLRAGVRAGAARRRAARPPDRPSSAERC